MVSHRTSYQRAAANDPVRLEDKTEERIAKEEWT